MNNRLVITSGRLIDPKNNVDREVDLVLEDGKVGAVLPSGGFKGNDAERLDAKGKVVSPGFIDLHVHLREPGEEYKEDIETGSRSAARGGFTSIVAMPNTKPVIDNAELVTYVKRRGLEVGLCRVLPTGAVTVGQKGEQLASHGEMHKAGAVALTDDGQPVMDGRLMRSALEYARDFDLPVLTHAEDKTLSKNTHMNEGAVSTRLGLPGVPNVAEDAMVARDVFLAEYTGGQLHVCHVSTAGAVEIIRQARARGVRVTGEAAPHHFSLTDDAVAGEGPYASGKLYNTSAKMNPPLRRDRDRQAVIAGLADGTLQAIATDHAPHSSLEKDCAFAEAMNGVVGLETSLALTLALVRAGSLTLTQAIERLTSGPAAVLNLPTGNLALGAPADVTIFDPDATFAVDAAHLASKSKNSPFLGQALRGRVLCTVLAGKVVHRA